MRDHDKVYYWECEECGKIIDRAPDTSQGDLPIDHVSFPNLLPVRCTGQFKAGEMGVDEFEAYARRPRAR